ncbi:MAG: hypothetical protein ABJC55_15110, partial [Algoriphagus sp.]
FLSEKYEYQSLLSWLYLGIFPLALAAVGYFMATVLRGSTINQQKQRQLVLIWLLFSAAEFFIIKKQAAYQLVILIPGLTYLITQFFLNTKKEVVAKIAFNLLVLGLPTIAFWYWHLEDSDSDYFVTKSETNYTGDILVLGDDLSPYLSSRLGGPFLNYRLSKLYLGQERDLREKARLFQMLQKQKPTLVLDPNGDFEKLMRQFPALEVQYRKTAAGSYSLKPLP